MKRAILILTAGILLLNCSSDEPESQEVVLQKIYDNSGGKGDATAITMEDLKAIGLKNLEDANLSQYQNAISIKKDFSNPAKVGEMQAVVMNINNICSYNSMTLDPLEYRTITKQELIGSWKLEAYVYTSNCSIDLTPSNPIRLSFLRRKAVIIDFHEDNTISGDTPGNALYGKYSFEENKASILEFGGTKAGEPEWVFPFYSIMGNPEYVTVSNDKLIIHSDSQNAILIFTKCQAINRDETLLNSPSDPFDIDSYEIIDDCLKITIRYGGGCGNVDLSLIPFASAEIFPLLLIIKLVFDDEDYCKALVRREFCFDIKPLRVLGSSSVYLETEDLSIKILYEY